MALDKDGNEIEMDGGDKGGAGDKDGKGDNTPYLGDWKTKEDAEKGFMSFKEMHDKQGNELGGLRKQVAELTDALSAQVKASSTGQDANDKGKGTPSLESSLKEVFGEYGKLDFFNDNQAQVKGAELMQKAVMLTAEMTKDETLSAAGNQFQETLSKRDAEALKDKFLKENPDFAKMQKEGAFNELKANNPLHDDFSAYLELQKQGATAKVSELEAALAEAKKVAELAGGEKQTGRVYTRPGGNLRNTDNKPKTPLERRQSAFDAVMKVSQGGG